jgi:hypothetical protein
MIAACALVHSRRRHTTRNVGEFARGDIPLSNPFAN